MRLQLVTFSIELTLPIHNDSDYEARREATLFLLNKIVDMGDVQMGGYYVIRVQDMGDDSVEDSMTNVSDVLVNEIAVQGLDSANTIQSLGPTETVTVQEPTAVSDLPTVISTPPDAITEVEPVVDAALPVEAPTEVIWEPTIADEPVIKDEPKVINIPVEVQPEAIPVVEDAPVIEEKPIAEDSVTPIAEALPVEAPVLPETPAVDIPSVTPEILPVLPIEQPVEEVKVADPVLDAPTNPVDEVAFPAAFETAPLAE